MRKSLSLPHFRGKTTGNPSPRIKGAGRVPHAAPVRWSNPQTKETHASNTRTQAKRENQTRLQPQTKPEQDQEDLSGRPARSQPSARHPEPQWQAKKPLARSLALKS
jgi:hypothetical protein